MQKKNRFTQTHQHIHQHQLLRASFGRAAPAQQNRIWLQPTHAVGLGHNRRACVEIGHNLRRRKGGHFVILNVGAYLAAGRIPQTPTGQFADRTGQ